MQPESSEKFLDFREIAHGARFNEGIQFTMNEMWKAGQLARAKQDYFD
jgi:hypothetical protein